MLLLDWLNLCIILTWIKVNNLDFDWGFQNLVLGLLVLIILYSSLLLDLKCPRWSSLNLLWLLSLFIVGACPLGLWLDLIRVRPLRRTYFFGPTLGQPGVINWSVLILERVLVWMVGKVAINYRIIELRLSLSDIVIILGVDCWYILRGEVLRMILGKLIYVLLGLVVKELLLYRNLLIRDIGKLIGHFCVFLPLRLALVPIGFSQLD